MKNIDTLFIERNKRLNNEIQKLDKIELLEIINQKIFYNIMKI